jgi:hypothetical protein
MVMIGMKSMSVTHQIRVYSTGLTPLKAGETSTILSTQHREKDSTT